MNIRLIGSSGKEKNLLNEIVKTFECDAIIEEIEASEKQKYHIKNTPAIIIENVVISEGEELTKDELSSVVYQFIEA